MIAPRLLLAALSLALAGPALAAPTGLDTGAYAGLFGAGSTTLDHHDLELDLDGDEGPTVHLRIEASLEAGASFELPLLALDRAAGDRCGLEDGPEDAEVVVVPGAPGFGHLGDPATCVLRGRVRTAGLKAHVTLLRPSQALLGDAAAWWLPVQPLDRGAVSASVAVTWLKGGTPRVEPHGWSVDLLQADADDRRRLSVQLDDVAPLGSRSGIGTLVGRVPGLAVTTGQSWNDLAMLHRRLYDEAAGVTRGLGGAIGRVLGQPDPAAAVREAARLAFDSVELVGQGGGMLRIPERAPFVFEDGKGTEADRAALFVALLRAVEIRAEVLLTTDVALPIDPERPLPLLDRTLVLLPKTSLEPGGGALFVDPRRGSAALGLLDEDLLGRDAVILAPRGARWLSLPDTPPSVQWTLSASERSDGAFQVSVTGDCRGAPGARIAAWDAAGRAGAPPADLAWIAAWAEHLEITILASATGARVEARGDVPRALAVPRDRLLVPPRAPVRVGGRVPTGRRTFARDVLPARYEANESWTFRKAGAAAPSGEKISPFGSATCVATWSGPVLNRKTTFAVKGGEVPTNAVGAVEALLDWLDEVGAAPAP